MTDFYSRVKLYHNLCDQVFTDGYLGCLSFSVFLIIALLVSLKINLSKFFEISLRVNS